MSASGLPFCRQNASLLLCPMLDVGCWILDIGCSRFKVKRFKLQRFEIEYWMFFCGFIAPRGAFRPGGPLVTSSRRRTRAGRPCPGPCGGETAPSELAARKSPGSHKAQSCELK